MNSKAKLPLVYSCSGASSAAQMANHIAVRLDRLKVAEMSCIAGVGGDVKPLVRTAKSGRPIIALDGCPLQCAAQILKRHGLKANMHYDLSKMGVPKKYHEDFDPQQASNVAGQIARDALSLLPPLNESDSTPSHAMIPEPAELTAAQVKELLGAAAGPKAQPAAKGETKK